MCFRRLLIGKGKELYNAENCAALGFYCPLSDDSLPTFRANLSVPSTKFKNQGRRLLGYFEGQGSKRNTSWILYP